MLCSFSVLIVGSFLAAFLQKQSLNELSLYKDYTSLLHARNKSQTSQSLTADRHPRQRLPQQLAAAAALPWQRDDASEQKPRRQDPKPERPHRRRRLPAVEPLKVGRAPAALNFADDAG